MVVETAYGFTLEENDHETNIFNASLEAAGGYPATPRGADRGAAGHVERGRRGARARSASSTGSRPGPRSTGAGWDPADPTSGDGWENQALFDYAGRALPALRVFDEF